MRKIISYIICIIILSSPIAYANSSNDTNTGYASQRTLAANPGTINKKSQDKTNKSIIELKPKLDTNTGKYGYVDKNGKWVIVPKFEEAKDFSEGLAVVKYFDEDNMQSPTRGYIDSKGEPAFKNKFFWTYDFRNGYATVTDRDSKVSLIDKKGNVVLKTDYYLFKTKPVVAGIHTEICEFPLGRSAINPKVGYITISLKLIKPIFTSGPTYFDSNDNKDNFAFVNSSESDSNGKEKIVFYLLNPKMEPVALPSGFVSSISEGMILLNCGPTFAYVNKDGKVFDEIYVSKTRKKHKIVYARAFSEGYAVVGIEGVLKHPYNTVLDGPGGIDVMAYGYMNKDGTTFKEPQYLSANSFHQGLAAVQPYPAFVYSMALLKTDGEYLEPLQIRQKVVVEQGESNIYLNNLEFYSQGEYDYVKSEVKRIVKEITNNKMSDLERLAVIQKYVIDHAGYGGDEMFDPTPRGLLYYGEAIGILKNGRGICDAYAKLTGLLLTEAGIETKYMIGKVLGRGAISTVNNHAWLLVKINGVFYHLDPTWNDDERTTYRYYLVSDQYMKEKGTREWDYSAYPAVPNGYFNDDIQSK